MRALISVASAVLLRWASQELKDVLKSQRIASEIGPRQCQSERLHGRFQAPAVVQRQNFATGGALYGIALYAGDGVGSRQWFLCRPVCAVLDRLLKKIQPGAKGNRAEVLAIRSETELFGARLFSATA